MLNVSLKEMDKNLRENVKSIEFCRTGERLEQYLFLGNGFQITRIRFQE